MRLRYSMRKRVKLAYRSVPPSAIMAILHQDFSPEEQALMPRRDASQRLDHLANPGKVDFYCETVGAATPQPRRFVQIALAPSIFKCLVLTGAQRTLQKDFRDAGGK